VRQQTELEYFTMSYQQHAFAERATDLEKPPVQREGWQQRHMNRGWILETASTEPTLSDVRGVQ